MNARESTCIYTRGGVLLLFCVLAFSIGVGFVEAASTSWSTTFDETLYYRDGVSPNRFYGNSQAEIDRAIRESVRWVAGVRDPHVRVIRNAYVLNETTGEYVTSGGTVSLGDELLFTFSKQVADDVRIESDQFTPKFAVEREGAYPERLRNLKGLTTGQYVRSECKAQFGVIERCTEDGTTCSCMSTTYTNPITEVEELFPYCTICNLKKLNEQLITEDHYSPICRRADLVKSIPDAIEEDVLRNTYLTFVVAPTEQDVVNTAGLSCEAPLVDGSVRCVVTDTGEIAPTFMWSETFMRAYHRYAYQNTRVFGSPNAISFRGHPRNSEANCFGSNIPLHSSDRYVAASASSAPSLFEVSIPTISLPITLNVVSENADLDAPMVTGPEVGSTSNSNTFTLTSSINESHRFGLDWNDDNIVDQFVPHDRYEGSAQIISRSWPSAGIFTFNVLLQTKDGQRSEWTPYTIEISNARRVGNEYEYFSFKGLVDGLIALLP